MKDDTKCPSGFTQKKKKTSDKPDRFCLREPGPRVGRQRRERRAGTAAAAYGGERPRGRGNLPAAMAVAKALVQTRASMALGFFLSLCCELRDSRDSRGGGRLGTFRSGLAPRMWESYLDGIRRSVPLGLDVGGLKWTLWGGLVYTTAWSERGIFGLFFFLRKYTQDPLTCH